MMSASVSTHQHSSICNQYKQDNMCTPSNVSQLVIRSKETGDIPSLQFHEAKQIFVEQTVENDIANRNMVKEKQELKEWIADCKEEMICLRSKELQNEDDFEESMEEIDIKIGHLLNKLNEAKQAIMQRRKEKYENAQNDIKTQTNLIQKTLNSLSKTLNECDIKCDKSKVHNVLSSISEFPDIEYPNFENKELSKLKAAKCAILNISKHKSSSFQIDNETPKVLNFKSFSEMNDEDEMTATNNDQNTLRSSTPNYLSPRNSITSPLISPTCHSPNSSVELQIPPSSNTKSRNHHRMKRKDFQFISVIGRGSFGKICLVKKKKDGTKYAMKVLKKQQIIAQEQVDNINQEIKVLKHIKHPFLLRAHYVFQTESKIYLVLDYYRFGDLMSHLKQKRKFLEDETRHICAEVALAIGCLHSVGIVYRDLKPENLLVDEFGHICLCDFGLCKKVGLGSMNTFCGVMLCVFICLTFVCLMIGTPDYLAPEILDRRAYDKNVDWWSFGILCFELIVGIVPFYSLSNMEMYKKIKTQNLLFPSWISEECKDMIRLLLNRNAKERLGAMNDVMEIRKHQWFECIDWIKILKKEINPPYCPGMNENEDTDIDHDNDYDTNNEATPTPIPRLSQLDNSNGLLANYAI